MMALTRMRGAAVIVSSFSGFLRTSDRRCRHTVPRFLCINLLSVPRRCWSGIHVCLIMKFSYIKQNYVPLKGYSSIFCSSFLNFKGGIAADVQRPMFDYKHLKPRFDHIHFQSNYHPFFIHRYLKYSRFKQSIDIQKQLFSLAFLSPFKWCDPYETLFYEPKVKIGSDDYQIACMCCCYDDVESEESAWNRNKLAQTTDEKTIRISAYRSFCRL